MLHTFGEKTLTPLGYLIIRLGCDLFVNEVNETHNLIATGMAVVPLLLKLRAHRWITAFQRNTDRVFPQASVPAHVLACLSCVGDSWLDKLS